MLDEAHLVFGLRDRTDRVVIPPSALDELATGVPSDDANYLLRISEYDYEEAFLPPRQRGSDAVELGRAVHSKHFSVFVRMCRTCAEIP